MRHSTYRIVRADQSAKPPIVWIVDENGLVSVTNDAEDVVDTLLDRFPGHRIIYRDSMGAWDELRHEQGRFVGFAAARNMGVPV